MRSVVITGASTGIGRACVGYLIAKGFRVFGSIRRLGDADKLASEFGAASSPLVFDLTDVSAVRAGADKVERALGGKNLWGLVNNAGIAVAGPLLFLDVDDFRRQLDVNVTGQLIVTQAFAPLLAPETNAPPGRVVMVTSVGGRNASPFLGPYNASKFALEGFSESLRRELMLLGIDVIVVAPGAVATPIWDKAEQMDLSRYSGTPYASSLAAVRNYMIAHGRAGVNPERIAKAVWRALTVARPKTRYVITPDPLQNFLATHLPKRMVDRMIARRLGLVAK
jgi:hypothetical protein